MLEMCEKEMCEKEGFSFCCWSDNLTEMWYIQYNYVYYLLF
jgi:hypothetical protein